MNRRIVPRAPIALAIAAASTFMFCAACSSTLDLLIGDEPHDPPTGTTTYLNFVTSGRVPGGETVVGYVQASNGDYVSLAVFGGTMSLGSDRATSACIPLPPNGIVPLLLDVTQESAVLLASVRSKTTTSQGDAGPNCDLMPVVVANGFVVSPDGLVGDGGVAAHPSDAGPVTDTNGEGG